jgi:hypothetical protein
MGATTRQFVLRADAPAFRDDTPARIAACAPALGAGIAIGRGARTDVEDGLGRWMGGSASATPGSGGPSRAEDSGSAEPAGE